jgi:mannose/fructose/N-acetylgalactosamine-specific phosphotransferase system component IIC
MAGLDLLPFALLGAVLGLDVVSFPQAMISRPLVAATVAGAFAGDAERGLLIGAVLEMIALGTLPFGASRYPEWGSASVVGGALYAGSMSARTGELALAVLATLVAAWLSGASMVAVRHFNARAARRARPALDAGDGGAVTSLQLRGLLADGLRAGLVTAIALTLLLPGYRVLSALWVGGAAAERAVLAGLTAALGAATIWMLVRSAAGARVGIVLGLFIGLGLLL